jgi:hypothetical protein
VLATGYHPRHFETVIIWTAVTAVVMFTLAAGKALGNPVLQTEGRVTTIGGILAVAVLLGLTLNAAAGWVVGRPYCRVRAGLLGRQFALGPELVGDDQCLAR